MSGDVFMRVLPTDGDGAPGIGRVNDPVPEARSGLSLLTHQDLRRTARVRAFTAFMAHAAGA